MSELRVDPLTGLRVLLAPGAETRAPGGATAGAPAFVPGVPALRPDAETPPREASLDLFTSAAARGHHELLAWAPGGPLSALTAEELSVAMGTWRERMAAHAEAAHVHLHVDRDTTAAELHAFDFVPAAVARERERASAYATRTQGSDLLGDLVQAEVRQRARLVAYDDEAVLLAPYASRVPFQLMVVPRTPAARFEAPGPLGAGVLHLGLRALSARFGGPPPLALWVRTAPRGAERFCWRIDVHPHLVAPGGLELGTGVPVNAVTPEQATAELRTHL